MYELRKLSGRVANFTSILYVPSSSLKQLRTREGQATISKKGQITEP